MKIFQEKYYTWFLSFIAISFFIATTLMPQSLMAHREHGDEQVVFIKEKEALKQMLQAEAKITRRKESLPESKAAQAEKKLGIELDDGIYTFYMARNRKDGEVVGAAMVTDIEYQHGEIKVAIGIDVKGNITKAAVLSVSDKYATDLKTAVGVGLLPELEGVSIKKLISMANEASDSSAMAALILTRLRDTAVLLSTLIGLDL